MASSFFQQIQKPTHVRGTDESSSLDLIFTIEKGMVADLEIHSPIHKSDHVCIHFLFQCYHILTTDAPTQFHFNKRDFNDTRTELDGRKWYHLRIK